MDEFQQHVRAFVEGNDQTSMMYLEEISHRNIHDTVKFSLEIFNTDVPDNILAFVCTLIKTALRSFSDGLSAQNRMAKQRSFWFEQENRVLHPILNEAMYRGLSHPMPMIQNICATNLAYFTLICESPWAPLAGNLVANIDNPEAPVPVKVGSMKCLVELFESKCICKERVDSAENEDKLVDYIYHILRHITSDSGFDADTRVAAAKGVIALLETCSFVIKTPTSTNEIIEICYQGLQTATYELAEYIHKLMFNVVKINYRDILDHMPRLSELIGIGLNSDSKEFQVMAINFWYQVACLEREKREKGEKILELCGFIAIDITRTLCMKLAEIQDHTIDEFEGGESKSSVFEMALCTMRAIFRVVPQPVFAVIKDYFMDCVVSPSWEIHCGPIMALRCICDKPPKPPVSEMLAEVIHWPIEYAQNEQMNIIVRIQALKTIRVCLKYYNNILEASEILAQVMGLMAMLASSELPIVKYTAQVICQFCRVCPNPSIVDSFFQHVVPTALGLITNTEAVHFIDIMLCDIIKHCSDEAGPTIAQWVSQLLEFLKAPDIPENVGRCVFVVLTTIIDKIRENFPCFEAATEIVLACIGDSNERMCEEALMTLSALMMYGQKLLTPYLPAIWTKNKFTLTTGNMTLTNTVYGCIPHLFLVSAPFTIEMLTDVLNVLLGVESPTQSLLKCITMIESRCGPLIRDQYIARIIELFQIACNDIMLCTSDEVDNEMMLMLCTVLRGYTTMFIGNTSAKTGVRNDAFLRDLCPKVITFMEDLSKKEEFLSNDVLYEVYLLLAAIGRDMGAAANEQLNKRRIRNLLKIGQARDDAKISRTALATEKFLKSL